MKEKPPYVLWVVFIVVAVTAAICMALPDRTALSKKEVVSESFLDAVSRLNAEAASEWEKERGQYTDDDSYDVARQAWRKRYAQKTSDLYESYGKEPPVWARTRP